MINTSKKSEYINYAWNDNIQNYCLAKRKKNGSPAFIEPLQELKLSEMELDDNSLYEILQHIFYKRTGKIDDNLGFTGRDHAVALAKEINVW